MNVGELKKFLKSVRVGYLSFQDGAPAIYRKLNNKIKPLLLLPDEQLIPAEVEQAIILFINEINENFDIDLMHEFTST